MSVQEWWWEYDAKVALQNKLSGGEVTDGAAWAKARNIHAEKMKNARAKRP